MNDLLGTGPLVTLAAGLGLAIGSFLNVVVHRVPAGLSVVSPPSACPQCGNPIRGRDNVPVLGWLVLRGRCRDCGCRIPVRYPAVEAGTGTLFAVLAAFVAAQDLWTLAACLVVAAAGVALSLIDIDCRRLPFPVTGATALIAGAVLATGWVRAAVVGGPAADQAAGQALGVAVGAAVWLAVYGGVWLATSGRGMGLGDVALSPVLGGVLGAVGVGTSVAGLALGFLLGALVGTGLLLAGRRQRGGTQVPFGPFMILGALVAMPAGPALAGTYLRLVGLA